MARAPLYGQLRAGTIQVAAAVSIVTYQFSLYDSVPTIRERGARGRATTKSEEVFYRLGNRQRISSRRRWLAILLVLGAVIAAAPVGAGQAALSQQGVDADTVILDATIGADGDASWTVTYRLRLADANETAAFEELRAAIEANRTAATDRFEARVSRAVASASRTTGREMAVSNVSIELRQVSQPDATFGEITYRYEWAGFAGTDGGRLVAGDAIDRFILDETTVLRLRWPESYEATTVSPAPTAREPGLTTWRGPREFAAGQPRLELAPATTASPAPVSTDGAISPLATGGVLLLVLVGVGGAVLARRRREDGDDAASTADSEPASPDDPTVAPLLSNEERVVGLLEAEGGRLKQATLADRLEWTPAKTSQVVGDLRDAGTIEVFRLGRENVLELPDVDLADGDAEDDSA